MDTPVTLEMAREHGLSEAEFATACEALGRAPNLPELGVLSVMWSEHCSYKSSRVHLRRLPTAGPKVLQGPGENAGVIDLGDGWAGVFKMESHNHPSFIEPYQGAATGVGGILRDVFTMGARPVALLDSLRFGAPTHPRTPYLVRGVVAGIAGYGNAIGVPTVGGEVQFDPAYNGNILVNVMAFGVCRTDGLFFGRAEGIGNPILYVGARTGRDGIHGATMASAEFAEDKEARRPTVQVGDPFMEKLLLEACLEIFDARVLEGVQDMGAAGLTSSTVEMASRAGNGVELWLDAIPRRARNLTPYEILLSESQERMIMVAREGQAQRVLDICAKWDLDAVVVGRVTDTRRFVVRATPGYDPLSGDPMPAEAPVVVNLPVDLLTDAAPVYTRPCVDDPRRRDLWDVDLAAWPVAPEADLLALLGSADLGSRAWLWRQYDHRVRNGTVVGPGQGDAAVVRLYCEDGAARREKYVALSTDCNGRVGLLDPWLGGALAVAEACRNVACSGAEPVALTDCLNYGNPERPEVMAQVRDGIDGIAAACNALGVAVVSGNVSLYNETTESDGTVRAVLPTPTIGAVGQLRAASEALGAGWRTAGDSVWLLGPDGDGALGGSAWLTAKAGRICGRPAALDLDAEARLQRLLVYAARRGLVASAHDLSDGGLLVALAECCILSGLGATLRLPAGHAVDAAGLFGEAPSRALVSVNPYTDALFEQAAREHGVTARRLGVVSGARLTVEAVVDLDVPTLQRVHRDALVSIVGD